MLDQDRVGGTVVGLCCVQLTPSHVQVSLRPPVAVPSLAPPNITTWRRTRSKAMACVLRTVGTVAGSCCTQSWPGAKAASETRRDGPNRSGRGDGVMGDAGE